MLEFSSNENRQNQMRVERVHAQDTINSYFEVAETTAMRRNDLVVHAQGVQERKDELDQRIGRFYSFRFVGALLLYLFSLGCMVLIESSINKESLTAFLSGLSESKVLTVICTIAGGGLALANVYLGDRWFRHILDLPIDPITGKKRLSLTTFLPALSVVLYGLFQILLIKVVAGSDMDYRPIALPTVFFALIEFMVGGLLSYWLLDRVKQGFIVLQIRRLNRRLRWLQVQTGKNYTKYENGLNTYNELYEPPMKERHSEYIDVTLNQHHEQQSQPLSGDATYPNDNGNSTGIDQTPEDLENELGGMVDDEDENTNTESGSDYNVI